ncbi:MAG: protein-glutamate O-methyltransferase CheR [Proteobacteria bacterium]|nr:protein-glutamate O-methyltransferase CheR [Pseudomonadota bacterium]
MVDLSDLLQRSKDDEGFVSRNFIQISDEEFELFRRFIYRNFGINLTDAKRALLMNRLQKILKKKGFRSFKEYYESIQNDKSLSELSELIDAVSTNHTFFFRESAHFDYLVNTSLPELIPKITAAGHKDLRVWCAAASTGEEPYVIAMLMMEYLGADYRNWSAGLLATDISNDALNTAMQGIYTEERMSQVPKKYKHSYFDKIGPDRYQVKDHLKQEVLYRRFNLMNEKFPFKKPFHVIFCRNVMIYFDQATRTGLVQRLYDFTAPGGYLFIGNAETLGRNESQYTYIAPSIYKRTK